MTAARRSLYGFEYKDVDRRRAPEGERRTHDIKQMWQKSHEICNLAALGYKQNKIAELLDVTPATVSNTVNSELGMSKISNARQDRDKRTFDVLEEVERLMPKAIATYEEILKNEHQEAPIKLRKEVADTLVMDIGGFRAPTKIQAQTHHLTTDELVAMKERGKQALRDAKMLVIEQ